MPWKCFLKRDYKNIVGVPTPCNMESLKTVCSRQDCISRLDGGQIHQKCHELFLFKSSQKLSVRRKSKTVKLFLKPHFANHPPLWRVFPGGKAVNTSSGTGPGTQAAQALGSVRYAEAARHMPLGSGLGAAGPPVGQPGDKADS